MFDSDQVLPGNFLVEHEIQLRVPAGLSPQHQLNPCVVVARFCRPITHVAHHSGWIPRWTQLVDVLNAQPLGFMGVSLLWQYSFPLLPVGHHFTHGSTDFSMLSYMRCGRVKEPEMVTFEQRVPLEATPFRHHFICFSPQV
jgi:hypothetical protein